MIDQKEINDELIIAAPQHGTEYAIEYLKKNGAKE